MKLSHLRTACYLYDQFTDYDTSYLDLLRKYPILDLNKKEQVKALLQWLRSWGCRQFKKNNEDISISSIMDWYKLNETKIPNPTAYLIDYDLTANENEIIDLFVDLANRKASAKERAGHDTDVHIGPVGAAKTLFALRPNLFSPCDTPIYNKLRLENNGSGYVNYLSKIQNELRDLRDVLNKTAISWNDLFGYLKKQHRSYPKLVDEYYWITITKGCDPDEIEKIFQEY